MGQRAQRVGNPRPAQHWLPSGSDSEGAGVVGRGESELLPPSQSWGSLTPCFSTQLPL